MSEIEEEAVCRICRCGGSDYQPLFHPCRCRGSVRFVHEHCCLEWLRHNGQRQRCELCAAQLHFDPVYAVDAPQRLSAVELAVGLVARVLNVAVVVLHTAIALALWIVVLPMTVVAAFRYAVGGLPPDATASFSLLTVAYGGAIVIASIVVYILLVAFADLVALFYEETLLRFNEEDVVLDRAQQANAAVADPQPPPAPAPPQPLQEGLDVDFEMDEDDNDDAAAVAPDAGAAVAPVVTAGRLLLLLPFSRSMLERSVETKRLLWTRKAPAALLSLLLSLPLLVLLLLLLLLLLW